VQLRDLLEAVARGMMSPEEAERRIRLWAIEEIEGRLKLDIGRGLRRGVPEVILGEGKERQEILGAVIKLLEASQPALVSRLEAQRGEELLGLIRELGYDADYSAQAGLLRARPKRSAPSAPHGRVGILTAGTADRGVALEAKLTAEEMGCQVELVEDVGIAGLQRTLQGVKRLLEQDVDIIIAVAGMEGALPSVVASLSPVPVVALPSSRGYGYGGGGRAALLSALQACPLGLACVNIDAGVGAGIFAALVAQRARRR